MEVGGNISNIATARSADSVISLSNIFTDTCVFTFAIFIPTLRLAIELLISTPMIFPPLSFVSDV